MQVLPQCGHAVHEDAPDKVSPTVGLKLDKSQSSQLKCKRGPLLAMKQRSSFRGVFLARHLNWLFTKQLGFLRCLESLG